jgi:hypothetical protein
MYKFLNIVNNDFLRTCAYSLCMYYPEVKAALPQHPLVQEMLRHAPDDAKLLEWAKTLKQHYIEKNAMWLPGTLLDKFPDIKVSAFKLADYLEKQNNVFSSITNRCATMENRLQRLESKVDTLTSLIQRLLAQLGVNNVPQQCTTSPASEPRSDDQLPLVMLSKSSVTLTQGFVAYYEYSVWNMKSTDKVKRIISDYTTAVRIVKHFLPPGTIIPARPEGATEQSKWLTKLKQLADSVTSVVLESAVELRSKAGKPLVNATTSLSARAKDFAKFPFRLDHITDEANPSFPVR